MSSGHSKASAERQQRILLELIKQPGNDVCADCRTRNPRWASWNLGIFLCVKCAGIHRKMGTHISKVKSVTLDSWTKEQTVQMKSIGNIKSNHYYNPNEARNRPPTDLEDSERDGQLEKFILSKYRSKQFIDLDGPGSGGSLHGSGSSATSFTLSNISSLSLITPPAPFHDRPVCPPTSLPARSTSAFSSRPGQVLDPPTRSTTASGNRPRKPDSRPTLSHSGGLLEPPSRGSSQNLSEHCNQSIQLRQSPPAPYLTNEHLSSQAPPPTVPTLLPLYQSNSGMGQVPMRSCPPPVPALPSLHPSNSSLGQVPMRSYPPLSQTLGQTFPSTGAVTQSSLNFHRNLSAPHGLNSIWNDLMLLDSPTELSTSTHNGVIRATALTGAPSLDWTFSNPNHHPTGINPNIPLSPPPTASCSTQHFGSGVGGGQAMTVNLLNRANQTDLLGYANSGISNSSKNPFLISPPYSPNVTGSMIPTTLQPTINSAGQSNNPFLKHILSNESSLSPIDHSFPAHQPSAINRNPYLI